MAGKILLKLPLAELEKQINGIKITQWIRYGHTIRGKAAGEARTLEQRIQGR